MFITHIGPWYLSVLVHSHIEFVQKKTKNDKKGKTGDALIYGH